MTFVKGSHSVLWKNIYSQACLMQGRIRIQQFWLIQKRNKNMEESNICTQQFNNLGFCFVFKSFFFQQTNQVWPNWDFVIWDEDSHSCETKLWKWIVNSNCFQISRFNIYSPKIIHVFKNLDLGSLLWCVKQLIWEIWIHFWCGRPNKALMMNNLHYYYIRLAI